MKTIQLIKKVTGMCHEGGFSVTKFTSNSNRVLQSIPEKDRRSGVKDKDLVKNLPEDQVLDVLWNILKMMRLALTLYPKANQ